jgi:hypothetical protein
MWLVSPATMLPQKIVVELQSGVNPCADVIKMMRSSLLKGLHKWTRNKIKEYIALSTHENPEMRKLQVLKNADKSGDFRVIYVLSEAEYNFMKKHGHVFSGVAKNMNIGFPTPKKLALVAMGAAVSARVGLYMGFAKNESKTKLTNGKEKVSSQK